MTDQAPDPQAGLRARLTSPPARRIFRIIGLAILMGGVIWAVGALDLTLDQLSPGLVLLNFLLLSPLNLLIAAVTFKLTAQAIGRNIPLRDTVQTAALANVAEILPLPGGAMVRTAALVKAGAGVGESAGIVTLSAILTLSMTIVLSATAMALLGNTVGWWLALAGTLCTVGSLTWLGRTVSPRLLAAMVGVRVLTIVLGVLRLAVSFGAIGAGVKLTEAALYTVAASLGSTVAIVPGGFGINEAIAAGLAVLVASSPAAAFLAVALNQAVGLAAGAAIGGLFLLTGKAGKT